jgi:hemerythrin superfamily protein
MNAITLLKNDHKTVEDLFKRFEKLGPRAVKSKQDIVERIIRELSVHAAIEEMLFYPAIRAAVEQGDVDEMVLESLEEHHIVKWVLSELDGMSAEHERFDAKVTVLVENVRHHVEDEETELFPQVNKLLGRQRLDELGDAMAKAKKTAPTHPHPRSPDEPPGNLVAGAGAALVDKALDAGRKMVRQKGPKMSRPKAASRS